MLSKDNISLLCHSFFYYQSNNSLFGYIAISHVSIGWSTFTHKNEFMRVVELIAPFFRSKIIDETGKPAKSISVQKVEYSEKNWEDTIQYTVDIHLQSAKAQLVQKVIIREFRTNKLLKEELNRYSELEKRCFLFPDIDPDAIIHINRDRRFIIYEKNIGYTIDQFALPKESADFLMGRISAILQGSTVFPLDETGIRELLIFLLMNQALTDEERESIVELLEQHFNKIRGNLGGYNPCTLFNPSEIVLTPIQEIENINHLSIMQGKAIHANVSLTIPENISNDRVADIADYYSLQAYNEFIKTSSVEETKNAMINFLQGYNSVTRTQDVMSFNQMYPNGTTLDLQFLVSAWLDEAQKIRMEPINYDDFESRYILRYTYYLLMHQPFSELLVLY